MEPLPTHTYDYAVVRVVPRVEREEFLNAGVILYCRTLDYLEARVALDPFRLAAFGVSLLDLAEIERHLASVPRICAGGQDAAPIGAMTQSQRFNWLVAPRSAVIQSSPVHSGICSDPAAALTHLFERLVLQR